MNKQLQARLSKVELMIFDVDGVLTDGKMHYGPDGEMFKSFYVLDGLGIKLLKKAGIKTAIISARDTSIVNRRAKDLDIDYITQGASQKHIALAKLLEETGLTAEQCAYIGDDIIDLPILTRAGVSFTVPNANPVVFPYVDYVTQHEGGNGAVREVCDLLLQAKNAYDTILESFLQ